MKIEIDFPDSIYSREPETWVAYFGSLQEMANRMGFSYEKYHSGLSIKETSEAGEDKMTFVRQRMAMYDGINACDCSLGHELTCFSAIHKDKLDSGNTENLVDAANGLVLERIYPQHSKAHFRSQGSDESPGIVMV
jgi:hypothetical protein